MRSARTWQGWAKSVSPGQLLHLLLGVGADHDAVTVPGQDPRGVLDGLPTANLALLAGEEKGVSPQLIHAGLEGDPGAGGILLKDHSQRLALEIVVGKAMLLVVLHLVAHIENPGDILPGEVQQLQKVFLHLTFPPASVS